MPEIAGATHPIFEEGYQFEIVTLDDFLVESREVIIEYLKAGLDRMSINMLADHSRMKKIRDAFQEGDTIYSYESPWGFLCGCAGIRIVRHGEVVYDEIVMRS